MSSKRKNQKLLTVFLISLFTLTFFTGSMALAGVTDVSMISSINREITDPYPYRDTFFRSFQHQTIWTDGRNGNLDIYYKNSITGEERQLTTDTADQVQAVFAGSNIVWKDWRSGSPQLYKYDLTTSQELYLTDIVLPFGSTTTTHRGPKATSSLVVWEDYRNNNWDIYAYDLLTNQVRQITTETTHESSPDIWGTKIVYHKFVSGNNYDIYYYDTITGETKLICNDVNKQVSPKVYNNYIVWQDERNNPGTSIYDIYGYDLNTNQEIAFITGPGSQNSPHLVGTKLVYESDQSGNSDIYIYDIATGQSEALIASADIDENPRLTGNGSSVLWTRKNGTSYDIYRAAIITGPDSPSLTMQVSVSGEPAAYLNALAFNPASVTLDGSDGLKAFYTTSPWLIKDARGTGAGWYATMSSTIPITTEGKTIDLNYLKLFVNNVAKAADAQTSSDPTMLQAAAGVTMEVPRTVISAPVDQGMGSFNFTPSLELTLPASSYAGLYSSTLYLSLYESAPSI